MEKAKKPAYKYCIVQECKNSIRKTPDKLFFRLPNDAKIRKQWCKMMRKVYLSPKSCLYCCEDHFNVQEDTANYIEYNIKKQLGVKCSLRLKKGVVPHIFLCRKRNMPPPVVRMGLIKRQRLTLVNEALSEFAIKNSNVSKNGEPLQRNDHKLPNNMVNFMECHKTGSVPQILMKPDCLDTKFDCHPNKKCTSDLSKSSAGKRQKSLIEECLKDKNLNQDLVIQLCDEDIKVLMDVSVSETSEDITQSAKNCKNYRRRKKSANQAAVKNIKTERCRKYRQRQKMLEHDLQSEKEVLHPPSTLSLQLTLEPQPIITGMPPKTKAERQKAYRERLKTEKPNKYEEIRVKHLSKVKENIRKKNEILTEEEKEELRAKWRQANAKRAERKKKTNPTTQNNNTLEVRKISKNNTKMLKERLQKLTEENTQLKRRNKNLRQACSRMERRMEILKKTLLEQQTNNDAISVKTSETQQCDDTPLKKSNSFWLFFRI